MGEAGVLSDLRPNGIVNLPDVFLILIAVDEWMSGECGLLCLYICGVLLYFCLRKRGK